MTACSSSYQVPIHHYINLLIQQEPIDLYFRPQAGAFPDNCLRVAPDLLPSNTIKLDSVWINGQPYQDFDAQTLVVNLPKDLQDMEVRVRIIPRGVFFEADLLELEGDSARIILTGELNSSALKYLKEELERAHGARSITLDVSRLSAISAEVLRYLAFFKQKAGSGFELRVLDASDKVRNSIEQSELSQEFVLV